MNILVIEGDAPARVDIISRIHNWGYHVEGSDTGRDGYEKLKTGKFDLVLLDTALPDIPAQDLIKNVKESHPDVDIITLTGINTKDLDKEIRTLGIIYYMSKPINDAELKEILDHRSKKKLKAY